MYRSSGEVKTYYFRWFKYLPKEIEDVLNDQKGVVESAVVGVPHRFWRRYRCCVGG